MEDEIRLINEITANAVIHGGDSGGPYDQNKRRLYAALSNWIKAKGLENDYHIIIKSYIYKADEYPESRNLEGVWCVPAIVPVSEKPDDLYADYFAGMEEN